MSNKEFVKQRIVAFAKMELDPDLDSQVTEVLRNRFNVYLPQRPTLNDSLAGAISDHEIIPLILKYRTMS